MVMTKACNVHCVRCLRDIATLGFDFAGIHAVGSVHPRALSKARTLANTARQASLPTALVLVTKVKEPSSIAKALEFTGISWVQLHAPWEPTEVDILRGFSPAGTKVITLYDPDLMTIDHAQRLLESSDYLLIDSAEGGTGRRVPQMHLEQLRRAVPMERLFISGGLDAKNVYSVMEEYKPFAVDAQSALIGLDGEQDYRRMKSFICAARGASRINIVSRKALVLEKYEADFWHILDPEVVTREGLVAKFNLIESLEARSKYRDVGQTYWSRVERSVNALSRLSSEVRPDWVIAALVAYANVIYLPQGMLYETWRALYLDVANYLGTAARSPFLEGVHIFENDPSGMTNDFCHVNALAGRLDTLTMSRIDCTDKLADQLLGMSSPVIRHHYEPTLRSLLSKPNWLLLVDKALSGHSSSGDLERLVDMGKLAQSLGYPPPHIWVLAQVATDQAISSLENLTAEYGGGIDVRCAIRLTDTESASAPGSKLIETASILKDCRELSIWFSRNVISRDRNLDRMRRRSGDSLEFGYRNCGLLIADYKNCPTGSLPILWHSSSDFTGPYPRIHSRIGEQTVEQTQDKWSLLFSEKFITNFESLKKL